MRRVEINRMRHDGSKSPYSTRKKAMRSGERVEVAKAMHAFGPARRVFMHDIELVRKRNGPRLVVNRPNYL